MASALKTLTVALVLVGLASIPAGAEIKSSNVGCGSTACAEVWQFTCTGSSLVVAQVSDPVVSGDGSDTLMVTLFATSPTSIKGRADVDIDGTTGSGFSNGAFLNTAGNTTISGFAIVTNLSDTGASGYDISIVCMSTAGTFPNPKVFKRVQDQ